MASNSMTFGAAFAPEMEEAEGIKGGETVGDFFHYNLKNVPLKFNHPLSIPFIDSCDGISYEDIYYLDLECQQPGEKTARLRRSEACHLFQEHKWPASYHCSSLNPGQAGGQQQQVHGAGNDEVHWSSKESYNYNNKDNGG